MHCTMCGLHFCWGCLNPMGKCRYTEKCRDMRGYEAFYSVEYIENYLRQQLKDKGTCNGILKLEGKKVKSEPDEGAMKRAERLHDFVVEFLT